MKIEFEDMSRGMLGELKVDGIVLRYHDNDKDPEVFIYVHSEDLEDFALTLTKKFE